MKYFGKVKSIVGNEVEIELAKEPDLNGNGSNLPDGITFKESIGEDLDDTDKENTFALDSMKDSNVGNYKDSIQMDPGEGAITLGDMGDKDKLELEYTGETIKITIPTGANIFDTRSGSDSKLSAIKINSVIKISAQGTKETPIIQGIEIVE